MERRLMGKNGDDVSLLGFGCMRFPQKKGKIDEDEAEKMLDAALAGGINYFDTAWPYHDGKSEAFVGRVLSKHDRAGFYLATKLPCWLVKGRDDAERIFAEQLERLRTDHIDYYLLHALDANRWDEMERLGIYELLRGYKDSGKIRHLGFSFHDGYDAFERIIRAKDWDFCQIQYNYMDADEQAGTKGYRLAESLGVPLVIMEPLKGGSLARLPDDVVVPFRNMHPDEPDVSWSFRWLAGQDGVKVILSGMSSMRQLEENLSLFSGLKPLGADGMRTIGEVARLIRGRVRNSCSGCSYCMPCPNGVNIPRNFRIWNDLGMYRNLQDSRWQWHNPDWVASRADKCVECGQCERKCPQRIPIPAHLLKTCEEMNAIKRSAIKD